MTAHLNQAITPCSKDVSVWSASTLLAEQQEGKAALAWITVPPEYTFTACDIRVSLLAVDVQLTPSYQILSSSVLNGGYQSSHRYVNLQVGSACVVGVTTPQQVFADYLSTANVPRTHDTDTTTIVGMMTAASMRSCRVVTSEIIDGDHHATLTVIVTSGIGNLRAAGDRAEYRHLYSDLHKTSHDQSAMPNHIGTINIFAATSVALSPAAQVEALLLITEAKVLALAARHLTSPISGQLATGTGTDAVAIACPLYESACVDFVGKHTVFGERLGRAVYTAVLDSISPAGSIDYA
jgi:adenosylcobinamide hydrolase